MNTLYKVKAGSRLYGLADENSDTDYEIIVFPTRDQIFGILANKGGIFTRTEEVDVTSQTITKFCLLLSNGAFKAIELLFAPDYAVEFVDPLFKKTFIDKKHDLVAENVLYSLTGFATSNLESIHKEPSGKAKRKKLFDELGYDGKYAAHTWRILKTGIHYIETGDFKVDWSNERDYFLGIKYGKISLEKTLEEIKDLQEIIKKHLPNEKTHHYDWLIKLNKICIDFSEEYYQKEILCLQ